MRIAWHGHSFYQITTRAGTRILLDPYVDNGKARKTARDFDPDVILLTHAHADHLGSVLEYREAHVVANWEVAAWLERRGITRRTAMNIGGTCRPAPDVRVTMTFAAHSSGLDASVQRDGSLGYGGTPAGFLIDDGETRLYAAGDTGLFGDMKWVIRDVLRPDVAILPIGDVMTMGPEHAALAAEWLGVKVAIPSHYGTIPIIDQDPEEFRKRVGDGIDVRVLEVDGEIEVRGGRVVG